MGEKLKYYQRISEAQSSGGRVWSFIFDGMSKFRTRLPILGNAAQMSEQFDNDVMGCIFHNDKRTQLYVSGPSTPGGVSYMIHCVHAEIKRCIEAGIPLPEKIYVHVDGAADNTAYAFMAAMEHLVGSGLCQILEVWRLPVGHTHEVSETFLLFPTIIVIHFLTHVCPFYNFYRRILMVDLVFSRSICVNNPSRRPRNFLLRPRKHS